MVPLSGRLKKRWMGGDYRGVLEEVKKTAIGKRKKGRRTQSVRLLMEAGNIQLRAMRPDVSEIDLYLKEELSEKSREAVAGFVIRISSKSGRKGKRKRKESREETKKHIKRSAAGRRGAITHKKNLVARFKRYNPGKRATAKNIQSFRRRTAKNKKGKRQK